MTHRAGIDFDHDFHRHQLAKVSLEPLELVGDVLSPNQYPLVANLASALYWTGETERAMTEYRRAIDLGEALIEEGDGTVATMIDLAGDGLADIQLDGKDGFTRLIRREPLGLVFVVGPVAFLFLLVDLVETGRTLRENNLVILEEVADCQASLIVNRVSHRLRLAEIRQLLSDLQNADRGGKR